MFRQSKQPTGPFYLSVYLYLYLQLLYRLLDQQIFRPFKKRNLKTLKPTTVFKIIIVIEAIRSEFS